ncbi:MAG: sugar phosphate isomerase/epimerase family protein [Candidatus Theseobacter exili]|nr:sugar phosphate isomerase/epimerase family protein [Candidatus Theseobacter exili]
MIKCSFSTIAFRNDLPDLTFQLNEIEQLGYDGVELWHKHIAPENIALLKKSKLHVSLISLETRDEIIAFHYLDKISIVVEELLCTNIRVFAGSKPSNIVSEKEKKIVINNLQRIADHLCKNNINVLIENHPFTYADTISEAKDLIVLANRPNIGLNLDISNIWEAGGNPIEEIDEIMPFVRNVHIKNVKKLTQPDICDFKFITNEYSCSTANIGNGVIDYRRVFEKLVNNQYNGYVAVEWLGENPLENARIELSNIKNTIDSLG